MVDVDVQRLVMDGFKTELGDLIDHRGFDHVREGVARALHDLLCNDDHLGDNTYEPEVGGLTRYQRQADAVLHLLGHERAASPDTRPEEG